MTTNTVPGISALQCVISSLRDTAHFSDEEGELTDQLRELRDWALSTAAQPLTQDEQENQLCMSSASCGQASTNESAFITSTRRSAGTFSAASERQSYRDSDGMPTERAVLEREWRRMKIALSATAAQPPAGFVLVPIELAKRVQETMGEFLMDHGWRQQDMDTSDEFDAALAAAAPAPAAKEGGA